MTLALVAFPMFDTTDTLNLAPRLRKYVQRYENRATALNLTNADRNLALLLDYAGEAVYDDFQTLVIPDLVADNPCDIYVRLSEALDELYAKKSSTRGSTLERQPNSTMKTLTSLSAD